jgi:subtilisin family serine protease
MSTQTVINLRPARWFAAVIGLVAMALPAGAYAQQHRARMSREVADHVNLRHSGTIDVLVALPQSVLNRLSQQYGVKVKQIIENTGAVVSGSAQQLDQMANDAQVDDIAIDGRVFGRMAVTTQATGANQVWAKDDKPYGGITGQNINVAIIDSGVASNQDLTRVIFSKDFTDSGTTVDQYGHGTHLAGIIGGRREWTALTISLGSIPWK